MRSFSRFPQFIVAASAAAAILASAPVLSGPLFQVQEGAVPGTGNNLVTGVDRISFDYKAGIDQTIVGGDLTGVGDTFTETGFLAKAAYGTPGGGVVPSNLNAVGGYGIYGLFTATGEADLDAGGTGIIASFTSFNMSLWVDPDQDTTLSIPGTLAAPAFGPVAVGGNAEDLKLADFTLDVGAAHIFGGLANGDFDTFLNVTLTNFGKTFFVDPAPFFPIENMGGNTQNFGGGSLTQSFVAYADGGGLELFQTRAVPEPGVLALFGLGLLGMGATRLRRNNKK